MENGHSLSLMGSGRGFSGMYLSVVYKLGFNETILRTFTISAQNCRALSNSGDYLRPTYWGGLNVKNNDLLIFRRRTGVE